jgi:hypothetical protein
LLVKVVSSEVPQRIERYESLSHILQLAIVTSALLVERLATIDHSCSLDCLIDPIQQLVTLIYSHLEHSNRLIPHDLVELRLNLNQFFDQGQLLHLKLNKKLFLVLFKQLHTVTLSFEYQQWFTHGKPGVFHLLLLEGALVLLQ